jgi:aspartyl protease family protein
MRVSTGFAEFAMWRYVLIALSPASVATQAPKLLQDKIDEQPSAQRQQQAGAQVAALPDAEAERDNPLAGRTARVEQDGRGHFVARAKMNGRSMDVLVDTGATQVAINASTARRMGIRLEPADFKYKVRTANGTTHAAATMIDEIQIGRVIVRNVEASVLEDDALSSVLLGMSFLNKLKKFEIDRGTLVLRQ